MPESVKKNGSLTPQFKRKRRSFASIFLNFSGLINIILASILFYWLIHPVEPKYYGTINEGKTFSMYGLLEPNQSDAAVTQWANQAAISLYKLDFVNYGQQLGDASPYFTSQGWQEFLTALQDSNIIDEIRLKRLTITAVSQNTPIILRKGVLNGRYSWRIQIPILISYQSASSMTQQTSVVTMLVTRISTLQSYRGIGISQFSVGAATGGLS